MNSVTRRDDDDGRLMACVRPPDWRNPVPRPAYDLVVIGGGTAGLVCAAGAAGLGARVALVERDRLGGDCLNTGCVPSKALLRSARVVGEMRRGSQMGVAATARPDFDAVMARLRARRADIAPNDSASRLVSLGVDVFFGAAAFAGRRRITVRAAESGGGGNPATLMFRTAVIATGSRPAIPPIDGLAGVRYLTNEDVFELRAQPEHLIVLGGGPVGCELAQAFARLGTRVTLIEAAARLLPGEDADASAIVAGALARDGVDVRVGVRVTAVAPHTAGVRVLVDADEAIASTLLVATGRTGANIDGLGLDAAGVEADERGIRVSDRMRTTNSRIFASGDVASAYKFTHAADALSRIVIQNALFFGRKRANTLVIPWCTFTDPEVAHVGVRGSDSASGAVTIQLRDVDRAVVDDDTEGFVRIHHRHGRIVGATVVGHGAGEVIATIAHAMRHGHGLGDLSAGVFPYPTLSLALRQAGDAYRRATVTPGVRKTLEYHFPPVALVDALLISLALMQQPNCRAQAEPYLASAAERGDMFDLAGAAALYFAAAGQLCVEAEIAGHYLRGLVAARAAYREGGSPASLAPVGLAIAAIDARAARSPAMAATARSVLLAAAAAAQSERDEMSLLLEHALRLEAVQLEAGEPPLPVATAHDVAGDLWLQVHRYEDAQRAFEYAARRVGARPRIMLGQARAAARLKDVAAACAHYQTLLAWWDTRRDQPAEITEARWFVAQPGCSAAPAAPQ